MYHMYQINKQHVDLFTPENIQRTQGGGIIQKSLTSGLISTVVPCTKIQNSKTAQKEH